MTATALELLAELRARGVHLARAEGGRLAATPSSLLDDRLRAATRESKAEILAALEDPLPVATDLGAVKLRSNRFGRELWLARNERVAAELAAEMEQSGERLPVLLFSEVEALCRKSPAMIRATLDAMTELPGSRLLK